MLRLSLKILNVLELEYLLPPLKSQQILPIFMVQLQETLTLNGLRRMRLVEKPNKVIAHTSDLKMLFPGKKTLEELDVKNSKVDDILPDKGLSVWNSRRWHPGKKEYIRFFDPYYKNVDYNKWVFNLIVWQEDN